MRVFERVSLESYCSLCDEKEDIIQLPSCGHISCRTCISTLESEKCPFCRQELDWSCERHVAYLPKSRLIHTYGKLMANTLGDFEISKVIKPGHIFNGFFFVQSKTGASDFYNPGGQLKYRGQHNEEFEPEGYGESFHVTGKYRKSLKVEYAGLWKSGKKEGKGKSYDIDGSLKYTGSFRNNAQNGEGLSFWSTKFGHDIEYEGEWIEDCREGEGTLYWPFFQKKRIKYQGKWKKNKFDGFGRLFSSVGRLEYEGHWEMGFQQGFGRRWLLGDGIIFEGMWNQGDPKSGAIYREIAFDEGVKVIKVYEGSVNHAYQRHGKGTSYDLITGEIIYEGFWKCDLMHGIGRIYEREVVYEGEFAQNLRHGFGAVYERAHRREIYRGNWNYGFRTHTPKSVVPLREASFFLFDISAIQKNF